MTVCIEPPLQALTGELLSHEILNSEDGARLEVSAQVFGVIVTNGHFLMYVFTTQMLPLIKTCSYMHTAFMNTKSRALMINVYGR